MRILVHGEHVDHEPRLAVALAGLAARGHLLGWVGGSSQPDHRSVRGLGIREVAASGWDVVLGAGAAGPVVALGRRGSVSAMVLAADAGSLSRGSLLERMAWDALPAIVLIDEVNAGLARGGSHGVALERFGLWPAVPQDVRLADVERPETEVLERACERALARSRGPAPRAGLFVDRDGTLIVERGYLADPAGVELLPGVSQALREARTAGHPVVVISNQAGVGRGRFTLAQAYSVMAELRHRLRAEGVELDAIHMCPHAPDADCHCRKPGTLLFERAAEDLAIHLPHSLMVGDKRLDAEAGRRAGMVGAIVATGYGGEEEGEQGGHAPERRFDDLPSAVRWFLAREDARVIG